MDPLAPLPLASAGGLLLSVNKGAAAIPPLLPTAGGKVSAVPAGAAEGKVGERECAPCPLQSLCRGCRV